MKSIRQLCGTVLAVLVLGASAAALAANGSSGGGGGGGGGSGGSSGGTEVPGEILVKLRATAALPGVLARYPVTLLSQFGARPIYRLGLVGAARAKDVLGAMALDTDVMIAESNLIHRAPEARRNVPWTIGSASAYTAQWAPQSMRLPQAQAIADGTGVRVAVLDTGVDGTHPALAGRMLPGFDFVDFDTDPSEVGTAANPAFGHGTHVAGLIAMGAPGATIMPLRVLDPDGGGNTWVLAEALLYAADPDRNPATDDGAHVVNLSLGSLVRTRLIDTVALLLGCGASVSDDPIADLTDPGYGDDTVRCATTGGRGVFMVAAAGNDASNGVREYPAAESAYGLLSVASSSSNGRVSTFSNFGSWIDLAAPGDGITSTLPGGLYGTWSGTSMAAPLASATAALVISAQPGIDPKDVYKRLKRNTATMCLGQLRQLDAVGAVLDETPPALTCP